MKIKVIEIVRDGESFYLTSTSCWDEQTKNPLEATNYLENPNKTQLYRGTAVYDPDLAIQSALQGIRLKDDNGYAKSGVYADECFVVEFTIEDPVVNSRVVGRLPR